MKRIIPYVPLHTAASPIPWSPSSYERPSHWYRPPPTTTGTEFDATESMSFEKYILATKLCSRHGLVVVVATRLWRCHWISAHTEDEDHEDDAKQWEIEKERECVTRNISVSFRLCHAHTLLWGNKKTAWSCFLCFPSSPATPSVTSIFLLSSYIRNPLSYTAKHLPVISIFVAGIRVQTRNITRERIKFVSIEGMTRDIVYTGVYVVPYRLYPDPAYLRLVSLFNSIDIEIIIFLSKGRDCNRIW